MEELPINLWIFYGKPVKNIDGLGQDGRECWGCVVIYYQLNEVDISQLLLSADLERQYLYQGSPG